MKKQPARAQKNTIAVVYLARGADDDWIHSLRRFLTSYKNFPSEREHALYVLYKGFPSESDLDRAMELCSVVTARTMKMDDRGLDIGEYMIAVNELTEDQVCFLNTHSELLAPAWLKKLALHLDRPEVGLVGATGSFESLSPRGSQFPPFPNLHLRSNGFMIERELFSSILAGTVIRDKSDADLIESGSLSPDTAGARAGTGCPNCRAEWSRLSTASGPQAVHSTKDASPIF